MSILIMDKLKKPLIIGFSGKIGSGKDYIAKNIFLPILV